MANYTHVTNNNDISPDGYSVGLQISAGSEVEDRTNTPGFKPVFTSPVIDTDTASNVIFKIKLTSANAWQWKVTDNEAQPAEAGGTPSPATVQISVWTLMGNTWVKTMAKPDFSSTEEYLISIKNVINHFGTYSSFLTATTNYSIIGSRMYLQIEPTISATNLNADNVWDWLDGSATANGQNNMYFGHVEIDSLDTWVEYKREF